MPLQSDERRREVAALLGKCRSRSGRTYWRSLEELADSTEFHELMKDEFPSPADEPGGPGMPSRRQFLMVMAASMAVVGMEGCTRQPPEDIVPRVKAPEYSVPGRPVYYATACNFRGISQPIVVESHEGCPTKIEGNPDHPASRGATSAITQASILNLYDPDRSKVLTHSGRIATWKAFTDALNSVLENQRSKRGAGVHILTEPTTSPTLQSQLAAIRGDFPEMHWHQYTPVSSDSIYSGLRMLYGRPREPQYQVDQADVILSIGADFLLESASAVRNARAFSSRRKIRADQQNMNRLYVAESMPSITGAKADHRIAARPDELQALIIALAAHCGLDVGTAVPRLQDRLARWIGVAADDLKSRQGNALVMAGDAMPPAAHALAHAINAALGAVGRTVHYTRPVVADPVGGIKSMTELARDLQDDRIELLLILGGNPAYKAPVDLQFGKAIARAKLSIHVGRYDDETARRCQWHVPRSHELESWSDIRSADGLATIIQPLIAPLYNSRTDHEILNLFNKTPAREGLEIVKDCWRDHWPAGEFKTGWRKALHDGFVAGSEFKPEQVAVEDALKSSGRLANVLAREAGESAASASIQAAFKPDSRVWDGAFANNAWLQEIPDSITKLTWENAVLMSPATARRLGVDDEQLVEVAHGHRRIVGPVLALPGHADDCLTLHLGYGRRRGGRICPGIGFPAYNLRTTTAPWRLDSVRVLRREGRRRLARTQLHQLMEGRDLLRVGDIADFKKDPRFLEPDRESRDVHLSLYPEHRYDDYKWGMSIDLGACIGCKACMVACQAENNIPSVGREQVIAGREMHWIRIDRYFMDDPGTPGIAFQPVTCMHCEDAPCEVVCPVGATVHDNEGLNVMVYNRCVGTRYCSNNCPYKVRRFNFLQFADDQTPSLKLQRNPNVTVRSRGVMEKCTYCVQRISAARIASKKAGRRIRDGEVVTACQSVCPTEAIIFGDIGDKNSAISRLKREPHDYAILTELNTRPRTSYLPDLRNPNPAMKSMEDA